VKGNSVVRDRINNAADATLTWLNGAPGRAVQVSSYWVVLCALRCDNQCGFISSNYDQRAPLCGPLTGPQPVNLADYKSLSRTCMQGVHSLGHRNWRGLARHLGAFKEGYGSGPTS
jgi:hypothetical protein